MSGEAMGGGRSASATASLPRMSRAPAPPSFAIRHEGAGVPFDKRRLSYAGTFDDPWRAGAIRAIEWATGKAALLRAIRRFEAAGAPHGQAFWPRALAHLGIEVATPAGEVERIPERGPVVVVANHPHGLVDGMVMAALIGRVRPDYRILTRSLLAGVEEVARFVIPVPFPHEPGALQASLEMRRAAHAHLARDGCLALFPSGAVASSDTVWGEAVEREWSPFTAKLIARSRATVVPMRFTGQNSRAYQIANRLSPVLRQGLLIHEVVHAMGRLQRPVIGPAIAPEAWAPVAAHPRAMMAWLRETSARLRLEDAEGPPTFGLHALGAGKTLALEA